jgi:putative peptide maturation dehydrogenase
MKVRRCKVLYLEPRERLEFDLSSLMSGGNGLQRSQCWIALAPHLGEEVEVDPAECALLGAMSPHEWSQASTVVGGDQSAALKRLLKSGLVVASGKRHAAHRERDEAVRRVHWHPLAATAHAFSRWRDADAVQAMQDTGTETAGELREVLGPPPPEAADRSAGAARLPLTRSDGNDFDGLLARRATCRNFDQQRPLPQALFAQLMQRVFSAQSQVRVSDDTVFLKKTSPSGGGLHPIEAYLVVQNVEGVAPGLYHYHALDHALEPLSAPPIPLAQLAMQAVAQQHWFADAHVMVLLAPRYARSFWKYRDHAKAHRAIILEAGHLSQTLYLAATDAGLGAYITCAINEVPLEQAFGLDHRSDGALAICGFGWRGDAMVTMELDPAGEVWHTESESAP